MSRMQREKGAVAEREVVDIFAANRIECFRTQNIGGKQIRGDLYGVPGHFLEIRRREQLRVSQWMAEVSGECPPHMTPLLICRRSREPWMAIQNLDDWIDLLKEAKSL